MLFCRSHTTFEERYHGIQFAEFSSDIRNPDGTQVTATKTVIAPRHWSQTAVSVLVDKYFRKAGVPNLTRFVGEDGVPSGISRRVAADDAEFGCEMDARDVFWRIAGAWTYWGWKLGYFDDPESAYVFRDEACWLMASQFAAPNSPQWFNTGIWWAYGITGSDSSQFYADSPDKVCRSHDTYSRPQSCACFLHSINDSLLGEHGIMNLWEREARTFRSGGGAGSNFSRLRAKNEPLSSGGRSSGLLPWLKIGDVASGAIKSGGACLAPHTLVYTHNGPVSVKELADASKPFVCLSYDCRYGRYVAKWASAFLSGKKTVVRVVTDKGSFDLSHDHPMFLSSCEYSLAGDLRPGQSLFRCSIDLSYGRIRVHLRDGHKGKMSMHRLIGIDLLGAASGLVVHHLDHDKLNNHPDNLEIKSQSSHARDHNAELVDSGIHHFQVNKYPKRGEANPMSRNAKFWEDAARVEACRSKQRDVMLSSPNRILTMQDSACTSRMLNLAYRLLNAGYDISTFEQYLFARRRVIGPIPNIRKVKDSIENRFGSYDGFLQALNENNHRVISVSVVGVMDVYDVQVECDSTNDLVAESGHNFVIWSDMNLAGSGVVVHNSRRAAKMVIVDVDHPDIEKFISWKMDEEAKVAALYAGSRLIARHVKSILDAWDTEQLDHACTMARRAGVPEGTVRRVLGLCLQARHDNCCIDVYETDFEGEAYTTVSGQNANNSIAVSEDFMLAVENGEDWNLINRVGGEVAKTVPARDLIDQMALAAWSSADPGVIFLDNVNLWNTCLSDASVRTCNPCGEDQFLDDTACNLASLNVLRYCTEGKFDGEQFATDVRLLSVSLDITCSMSSYPSEAIAANMQQYRTIGLGISNLGGLITSLGLSYDSNAGRSVASLVTAALQFSCIKTSAEIASELGTFAAFERNRDHAMRVVANHRLYAFGMKPTSDLPGQFPPVPEFSHLPEEWMLWRGWVQKQADDAVMLVAEHGLRNATLTCMAPCGTIGLIMDCDTTGIEPAYALVVFKKLAGGGFFKLVNFSVLRGLHALGYTPEQILDVRTYALGHGTFVGCPHREKLQAAYHGLQELESEVAACVDVRFLLKDLARHLTFQEIEEVNAYVCGKMTLVGAPHLLEEHYHVFDCATPCGGSKRALSVDAHLHVMAAIQPFLSMGQSKTVNLPSSATIDDFKSVFMKTWKLGLRASAAYRDGSKLCQILNNPVDFNEETDTYARVEKIVYEVARRRPLPDRRKGPTQKFKLAGTSVFLRCGEYPDGSLGEIFVDMYREGATVQALLHHWSIAISIALQYGVPLEEFVDAYLYTRFEPAGVVANHSNIRMASSVTDMIVRDLAIHYLGRDDLAHVKPESRQDEPETQERLVPVSVPTSHSVASEANLAHQEARLKGYAPDPCPNCHSLSMVRSGPCLYCTTCGSSTGCA